MEKNPAIVLLVGATGFIGRALGVTLAKAGYQIRVVSRSPERAQSRLPFPCETVGWQADGQIPDHALDGVTAVVNLAGEGIAEGRWTAARKEALLRSRLETTQAVGQLLRRHSSKPRVWIQSSASGYYGPRGDEDLSEKSPQGEGFLADICQKWEAAATNSVPAEVRLVLLRIGVVLGLDGGALPKLASIRQKGASIIIGRGEDWLSWIHIQDLVGMIQAAIEDDRYQGPMNGTAPTPCQWSELDQSLATSPWLGVKPPSTVVRITAGEGPLALAASQRIHPAKALGLGYSFKFPKLDEALDDLLGPKDQRGDSWLYVQQFIPAPLSQVAPFFADEKNLEAITPPWLNFRVLGKSTPEMTDGTLIRYRLSLHGIPMRWLTRISDWSPPHQFVDEQLKGPYAKWVHRHTFEPVAGGTLMTDLVRFRLPLGMLGRLAAGWAVEKDVSKIFDYRRDYIGRLYHKS